MRRFRWVSSLKLQVSFAKEPYKKDIILQKRRIIWRSLLIVATPYVSQLCASRFLPKEPYKRGNILQKRRTILRSLLIIATPYVSQIYSSRFLPKEPYKRGNILRFLCCRASAKIPHIYQLEKRPTYINRDLNIWAPKHHTYYYIRPYRSLLIKVEEKRPTYIKRDLNISAPKHHTYYYFRPYRSLLIKHEENFEITPGLDVFAELAERLCCSSAKNQKEHHLWSPSELVIVPVLKTKTKKEGAQERGGGERESQRKIEQKSPQVGMSSRQKKIIQSVYHF